LKTILVTGATGVLAKDFISKYSTQYTLIQAKRIPVENSDVHLDAWKMEAPRTTVDLVIHFASKYLVDSSLESIQTVCESVIGTSAAVADFCGRTKTPLIALGSYFEKAPNNLQPWSYYASAKKTAFDLLSIAAENYKFPFRYVYCYDTYGTDTSRKKFIDILLEPATDSLELTEGLQMMNLTHIDDLVSGLNSLIQDVTLNPKGIATFQIRSLQDEITVREIAMKINDFRENKIDLKFGAKPYRNKEVFSVWDCAPLLPNYQQAHTFEDFLGSYFEKPNVKPK